MRPTQITNYVSKPDDSEPQFLLFTGNKKELDSAVKTFDFDMLAPLLVGMAVVVISVIIYAFLLGRLG